MRAAAPAMRQDAQVAADRRHADRSRRRRHLLREARRGRGLRRRRDCRHPPPLPTQSGQRGPCVCARRAHALSFIVDDPHRRRVVTARGGPRGPARRPGKWTSASTAGIDPLSPAAPGIVRAIAAMPGLRFRGLLSHAGHGYGATSEKAEAVARGGAGAARPGLGVGRAVRRNQRRRRTAARFSVEQPGVTELRPATMHADRTQVALGAAAWEDCALTVLARVVSRPASDRVILDSGSKTLTNDLARGFINTGLRCVLRGISTAEPDTSLLVERLSESTRTSACCGNS